MPGAGPDGVHIRGHRTRGQIIRITPDGTQVLADDLDSYVWAWFSIRSQEPCSPAPAPRDGSIKSAPTASRSVYYQTKQEHILCLAGDAQGNPLRRHRQRRPGLSHHSALVARNKKRVASSFIMPIKPKSARLLVTDNAIYAGTSTPTRRPGLNTKTTTTMLSEGNRCSQRCSIAN